MGILGPVLAGDWTTHGFIYKPSPGARGTVEKGLYDSGQDRVDARLNKEIWVGDPNYGTTIQTALTAMSSNPAILKVPAGTHSISSNLIVPGNVTLRVERGTTLTIPQGVTLSINGGLEAGLYQIFSCTGTGKVVFGSGSVQEVNADWFGLTGDSGTKNNYAPIKLALDSLVPGMELAIPKASGYYKVINTTALTCSTSDIKVRIDGDLRSTSDQVGLFTFSGSRVKCYGLGSLRGPGTFDGENYYSEH
jgi:hypothetical protein